MAFTKAHKSEIMSRYEGWVSKSQAIYVLSYKNMNMKSIDTVRAKIRDAGGEIHVVKNTLFQLVLEKKNLSFPKDLMEKSRVLIVQAVEAGFLGVAEIHALVVILPNKIMQIRLVLRFVLRNLVNFFKLTV